MAAASADRSEPTRRRTFLVGRVGPSTSVVRRLDTGDTTPSPPPWAGRADARPAQLRLQLVR